MNAPFVPVSLAAADEHQQMAARAEQWRGECIQQFAVLENCIEDLLQVLTAAPRRGRKVRTGEQVGVAFGHLRELTAQNGPFAKEGQAVSRSLQALALLFEWRAHLTHGVLATWTARGNRWLLTFEHRAPGGGPQRTHALPWAEAEHIRDQLRAAVTDLRSRCGSMKAALASQPSSQTQDRAGTPCA